MPLDVVDGDQPHAARQAQTLCVGEPHQQRADQARSHGDRDRVEIPEPGGREFQRLADYRHNGAQMLARGQLRDHASVLAVRAHLRRYDAGKHTLPVFHHGGGSFITRGFDAQDAHY